jgi:hypothetical protein
MILHEWLTMGFGATVVLTAIMAGAQGLKYTRMSIPYLLGTLFTKDRDRARVLGILAHLVNGWAFSFLYLLTFRISGAHSWWLGPAIGFVHGAFVLMVAMPALPGMHPNMASMTRGPTARALLEPPGFLALHYGVHTPITVMVAHLVFGAVLGHFHHFLLASPPAAA